MFIQVLWDHVMSIDSLQPNPLPVTQKSAYWIMPSALSSDLPSVLTDLYNSSYLALNYYDLLCKYNCRDCNC